LRRPKLEQERIMKRHDRTIDDVPARGRRREDDRTPELTGLDAEMDEAESGDAPDPTGGLPRPLEADPGEPYDITPDKIEQGPAGRRADEDRLTVRPREVVPFVTDPYDRLS
jgi:hypothetical protein